MVKGETKMASGKEYPYKSAELVPIQPPTEVSVIPPSSGFIGRFLEETANMFKARAMRMSGLQRRINEAGQRTEDLLRTAAQKMEAAEARIRADLGKEGLLPESSGEMD
jgi:hypothetical protein